MSRAALAIPAIQVDPGDRLFEPVADGRYRLSLPLFGIVFEADRLRWEKHELHGELAVACAIPGAKTVDGSLMRANANFSSLRGRQDIARLLAARSNAADFDWHGFIEELCQRVLVAERAGAPGVVLREVECPDQARQHLEFAGLALPREHAGILHGPGGTLKSYFALWLAGELQARGERVGYLDWELSAADHRLRLGRLFGATMPAVTYIRCERPLVAEVDRLRRLADDDELTYLVVDSIAFATDGPPEAAEVAGRYFRALRQLGERGSLHLAHTTKAEGAEASAPFGSIFWFNGARATWSIEASESSSGPEEVAIAIRQRKANLGPLRPAVAFTATFAGERTSFRRADIGAFQDLAAKLPIRQRLQHLLRRGARTRTEIAEALDGVEPNSLRRVLNREVERGRIVRFPDGDRFGLAVEARS